MTDEQIYQLFGEAANYADPDAFASDVSIALLDADNPDENVNVDVFEQLRILWHVYNDPFRDLLKRMGLNQSQCSRRFCIPLRTVQGWTLGDRSCAPYVRLMMAELTKILVLHND